MLVQCSTAYSIARQSSGCWWCQEHSGTGKAFLDHWFQNHLINVFSNGIRKLNGAQTANRISSKREILHANQFGRLFVLTNTKGIIKEPTTYTSVVLSERLPVFSETASSKHKFTILPRSFVNPLKKSAPHFSFVNAILSTCLVFHTTSRLLLDYRL